MIKLFFGFCKYFEGFSIFLGESVVTAQCNGGVYIFVQSVRQHLCINRQCLIEHTIGGLILGSNAIIESAQIRFQCKFSLFGRIVAKDVCCQFVVFAGRCVILYSGEKLRIVVAYFKNDLLMGIHIAFL